MRYRNRQTFGLNAIWVIIGITLMFFIATIIAPRLVFVLGLQPGRFAQQPWTAITSLFLHAGFWHLATNMFTLYFFGTFLVGLVGEGKFLLIYFGGGLLGSIVFVLLAPLYSIAIGASGAIFALGGALTAMVPKMKVYIIPIPVPLPLWVAVIGGFLIISLLPNIAWQAHLGGLVFGLVAGYFFNKRKRQFFL